MSLVENIKNLRRAFDMSQKDLGVIAGVTDKAVWAWEQGNREPRMGALQRLADHFGIKKSDLIDGDVLKALSMQNAVVCKEDSKKYSNSLITEEELTLIKKYRQLDADGKADINDLIDSKLARAERAAKEQEEALG